MQTTFFIDTFVVRGGGREGRAPFCRPLKYALFLYRYKLNHPRVPTHKSHLPSQDVAKYVGYTRW